MLCLLMAAFASGAASGAEPVVVINAPQSTDQKLASKVPQRQPLIEPSAPDAGWSAPPEPVAMTNVTIAQPASAGTTDSLSDVAPKPVVKLDPKPAVASPVANASAPIAADRLSLTRNNRKTIGPVGDDRLPVVRLPAAVADKDLDVITCVAGCNGKLGAVVYFRPLLTASVVNPVSPAVQSATPAVAVADDTAIQCIAGCYSTPKTYVGRAAPLKAQSASNARDASIQLTSAVIEAKPLPVIAPQLAVAKLPVRKRGATVRIAKSVGPKVAILKAKRPLKLATWRTVTQHSPSRQIQRRGWITVVQQ